MTSYVLSPDAACAVVDDGAVVLHMRTKRYFSLNETGLAIWRMLEDDVPVAEIAVRLAGLYEIEAGAASDAVTGLLGELASEELISVASGA